MTHEEVNMGEGLKPQEGTDYKAQKIGEEKLEVPESTQEGNSQLNIFKEQFLVDGANDITKMQSAIAKMKKAGIASEGEISDLENDMFIKMGEAKKILIDYFDIVNKIEKRAKIVKKNTGN